MANKKAESNRRNAQASTGPRDTSVTRFNAVQHGLTSANLTAFDLEVYEPTLQHFRAELQPLGEIEDLLVQRIALYATRLHRASSLTAEYLRDAGKKEIVDVDVRPRGLDLVTFAATGELPRSASRLSELKAAVEGLPSVIQSFTNGGEVPELAAALDRFSTAVEALPGSRPRARDPLKIVETLETRFQRYETQLENRMLRLLNELERIQRMRAGEAIPAPLNVNIGIDTIAATAFGDEM